MVDGFKFLPNFKNLNYLTFNKKVMKVSRFMILVVGIFASPLAIANDRHTEKKTFAKRDWNNISTRNISDGVMGKLHIPAWKFSQKRFFQASILLPD